MSWFRSSQRRPEKPEPAAAPQGAGEAREDEEAAEAAGLEPLMPPAAEPEPDAEERARLASAPLDFFSLDPLDDEWPDDDEEEEEDEEEEAAPAAPTRSRRRSGRAGRGSRRGGGRATEPAAVSLEERSLADLHAMAREAGIDRYRLLRREELIARLEETGAGAGAAAELRPAPVRRDGDRGAPGRRRGGRDRGRQRQSPETRERSGRDRSGRDRDRGPRPREDETPAQELERLEGFLEMMADGFAFLRVGAPVRSGRDAHVSREQVERYGLRAGDRVAATARPARRSERNSSVVDIVEVNGRPAMEDGERAEGFASLAALPPRERLPLKADTATVRMLEVVTPLGKGQRALIHGAGGAGATRLLQEIASALAETPVCAVAAVVDARPEELWEWQSSGAELFATSAEDAPADQVRGAGLALERSKRLVEEGAEVVLLVDSLTRLAHAHALAGGRGAPDVDGTAVHEVKRLFAAARATERGSLTIVAAARSDRDTAIDVELREALVQIANVELRLDAALADAGLYPAIDVAASRTRGEEALLDTDERARLDALRGPARALEGADAWRYLAEQAEQR